MTDPLAFPCRATGCKKPVGTPCVYTSGAKKGKPCPPHPLRVAMADGAASRDAAFDALGANFKRVTEANAQYVAALDESTAKVASLTADLADAQARIAELETPVVPTPARTIFGACILDKGAAGVVAKFGQGAAVRQFLTPMTPITGPSGSLLHLSAKSIGTDAQIDAWLKGGGIRTFKHEPDNDGMTAAQIAQWKADSNRLYDRNVALGRPCLIAPTFTGDFWSNHTTDAERDVWLSGLKGDLFGLDFDGVHDNQGTAPADKVYRVGKTPFVNTDEIDAIKRALAKYASNGWTGFTVPEFGTSRAPWDKDGSGRALWIRTNAQRFIDAGAYAVHYYDHAANGKSDVVDPGSPELAALQDLVKQNPTTK